jgi:hypothetical protein
MGEEVSCRRTCTRRCLRRAGLTHFSVLRAYKYMHTNLQKRRDLSVTLLSCPVQRRLSSLLATDRRQRVGQTTRYEQQPLVERRKRRRKTASIVKYSRFSKTLDTFRTETKTRYGKHACKVLHTYIREHITRPAPTYIVLGVRVGPVIHQQPIHCGVAASRGLHQGCVSNLSRRDAKVKE